ncbi:hypothetical protein [Brevundimonas sp.]|uniref:hypothetical protein n=1 Tax=Brevundimonas sp. TaxID=1871086 RepID=UPI002737FB91|nr:hypothetical protein [Brevundimonas sp.]MDP3801726.1 hypothetical protein [Brevundimonas sp.]
MTETYRIRSPETWAQAREDYLAGMDAEAVCSRHDLGLSAFRRRARREGWRRRDQDDPAPIDPDLSIYDDVDSDEQAELARLRFIQALNRGRSVEAARWRRLWLELRRENDALDAEIFDGMTRGQINALLTAEKDQLDARADRLAAPDRQPALAGPEEVHDVHSIFSSGDSRPTASPPGPEPPSSAPP